MKLPSMEINETLFRRAKDKSLSEEVYNFLRNQIVQGFIFQRERLVEDALSKQLGVSRTPVREAIKRLQADGLVTVVPNKGAQAISISIKEIEESYQVVAILEGYAAFLAIKKITKKEVERLKVLNSKLSQQKYQNDSSLFLALDKEFHSIYLNKCDNVKLNRIIKNELESIHRFRIMSHSISERLHSSIKQHNDIIKAAIAKDPLAFRNEIENHILHGAQILINYLKRNEIQLS